MAKLLVHLTCGTENPTKAALAFLVAKTAQDEGHQVTLFLAGDAVPLMRGAVLDNLSGLGTGKLRDHYDALVRGGAAIYLSGMSSNTRGLTKADVEGTPCQMAMPNVLVKLVMEHDKVITY